MILFYRGNLCWEMNLILWWQSADPNSESNLGSLVAHSYFLPPGLLISSKTCWEFLHQSVIGHFHQLNRGKWNQHEWVMPKLFHICVKMSIYDNDLIQPWQSSSSKHRCKIKTNHCEKRCLSPTINTFCVVVSAASFKSLPSSS